jgi:hypothetical protein
MKKLFTLILIATFIHQPLKSLVDFGGTWVASVPIYPTCLEQEYVSVGFHVNWEVNNSSFLIQRSTDPQFSWAINLTTINGCGTCGYSMHSYNDYGPFQPGQVWYYRVRATSNFLNYNYHNLGMYTCNLASTVNWISQVTNQFITGASPSTETSYTWNQENREGQGVNISLIPTEISNIYLELNNHKINFTSLAGNPFIKLEVNVNNSGYTTLHSGGGINSYEWNSTGTFNSLSNYNLKVKYTNLGGQIYLREYNIFVVPKSDGFYLDNYCNTIRVWKGNDPNNGIPLILSEGFDAYNTKSQQYYRESGKDLINCLLRKGFNVYIVDYHLNSQSIINNAAVFQSAIRYVSSINSNRKVVATGMSMGGVINRYACAQAESVNNPLPISKFVSIDAPHQGAVLSDSLQNWRKLNTSDPFEIAAANNDAAKQLLKYNAYDQSGIVRTLFEIILNTTNVDGYPHLVESIGIAFSNNTPNPNSGTWLTITPSAIQSATTFAMSNNEMLAGSYLPRINIDPLHFYIPLLRINVNINQLKDPCFIPHQSALDIVNGTSKFDKVIFPSVTDFHDKIPPSIIEEIVNALIEDQVYIQNKTIPASRLSAARKTLFAGENVNPNMANGSVNVTSPSDVIFKAGEEVSLQEGFQSTHGSEFAAIIGTIQCDNQMVFQNRMMPVESEPIFTSISSTTIPEHYLNNPKYELVFESNPTETTVSKEPAILPNPAQDIVYLEGFDNGWLECRIYSADNKLLLKQKTSDKMLSVAFLAKGIYFLNVLDQTNTVHNFKLIKN